MRFPSSRYCRFKTTIVARLSLVSERNATALNLEDVLCQGKHHRACSSLPCAKSTVCFCSFAQHLAAGVRGETAAPRAAEELAPNRDRV